MNEPNPIHLAEPRADGSIIFGAVGDIGFRRGVAQAMAQRGMDWPFETMRAELSRANILFGNMETVLIPPDYPPAEIDPNGMIAPFAGEQCAAALARAGFNFLNLAANHVLDAGVVGMQYTKTALESAGIATGGVGGTQEEARCPVILTVDGLRIGMLCYCEDNNYTLGTRGPCHAYFEPDAVIADIARLRGDVDIIVVSVHADLEFMPGPSLPRRDAFRRFAQAGADLVLGHHPHVPQGCERIGHTLIAYSLGNFIFPAHSSPYMRQNGRDTARSFLLLVELTRAGVAGFERIPFEISAEPEERPIPCQGTEREEMLRYLEELDRLVADDAALTKLWGETVRCKLADELKKAVLVKQRPLPRWRRALARLLGLTAPVQHEIDVERILDELVGRWWLTAENRSWMEEVIRVGQERWDARNALPTDPLHRPHHTFQTR
ncbi:MAG: CapA family protein [Pseudomonadota bacterium]|nr:MAG: CapA family protein [Pseudomonadota bacterium]